MLFFFLHRSKDCKCFNIASLIALVSNLISSVFQEIKFDPTVMCENIDKRLLFRSSQVRICLKLL